MVKLPPPLVPVLLLALAPLPLLRPVHAGTARAWIGVSVRVLPRARIETESIPSELVISAADIKRGFIERRRATRLLVENSTPVTFAVDVFPTAQLFSQVEVRTSGGARAIFGTDGGELVGSLSGRAQALVLDFRFRLTRELAPGRYPWPLRVDARLDY